MNKQALRENFSRCASVYDRYADIQRQAASELAAWIEPNGFRHILEIGCGTGNYTLMLRNKFRHARIQALDISEKMIGLAKEKLQGQGVEFLVRDAEDATFSEKFSLITSNAALQWFEDLREAIVRQAEMLEPGGRIYFSIFGPRTFEELSNAWAACWPSSTLPSVGFLPLEGIAKILQRCFLVSQTREEIYQEIFPTLKDLLRKIKYTGVRGPVLNGQGVLWPGKLKAIEQAYLERYKQIIVTYQVFFCQGAKG